MAVDIPLLSALLAAAGILLLTIRGLRQYNRKGHLPPGPTPLPLLGNMLDIPRSNVGPAFSALTKKYGRSTIAYCGIIVSHHICIGNITYLTLLGQPMVVIGSINVAFDLLDKKSANFSGRPVSTVAKMSVVLLSIPLIPRY